MAASRKGRPKRPPATTLEGRENQLIALAVDVAEEQMRNGKVSAQVLTHYLKLGTTREQLEQERIRRENLLLEAKVNSIASAERIETLYTDALKAMREYQGVPYEGDYEDQDLHRTQPD